MELKIIKTFLDGTVLVSSDEGCSIMSKESFENIKLRNLNLGSEIIGRLKTFFPHCTFSTHLMDSRDHIFMDDDIDLTNMSLESLEFWMRSERMGHDEIMEYIEKKLMPSIVIAVNKIEFERCKDINYFFAHYARIMSETKEQKINRI